MLLISILVLSLFFRLHAKVVLFNCFYSPTGFISGGDIKKIKRWSFFEDGKWLTGIFLKDVFEIF